MTSQMAMFRPASVARAGAGGRVIERSGGTTVNRPATNTVGVTRGRGSLNPFQPHRGLYNTGLTAVGDSITDSDVALRNKILATPSGVLIRTTNGGSPWRVLPQTSDALAYPFLVASRHNSPGIPAFIIGGRLVVSSIKTKSNSSFWAQAAAASAAASAAAQGTSPCSIHDLTNCTVPAYDGTTPITADFVVEGKIVSVDGVMYAQYGGGGSVGAPNAVAASNTVGKGLGEDCADSSECGTLAFCAPWSDTCVGLPTPSLPPIFCGANSTPAPDNLRCNCNAGYGDDGTGNCVALKGAIQTVFSDQCKATGGQWDDNRPNGAQCACADPAQLYDSVQGCYGNNPCSGMDGGEVCTDASGGTGACLGGNCVIGYCLDPLGNAGIVDDNGNCIGPQCPQGQGRGSITGVCQDCGINGFKQDGITCNECPPGGIFDPNSYGGQGSCDCAPGKQWNTDNTVCINTSGPPPKQDPPAPCPQGSVTLYDSAAGAVICNKPTPVTPPPAGKGGDSGGGYGLLIGLGAAGAALLLLMNSKSKGKSKGKRAHA